MTILNNQDTMILQKKLESLAEVFLLAGRTISTGSSCFRTSIDILEVKSLISKANLLVDDLNWQDQREAIRKIDELESFVDRLEEQPLAPNTLYIHAKATLNALIDQTLTEARQGKIFEGNPAVIMQAGVNRLLRKDIMKAVMETTSLEVLEDENSVRVHVIGAIVGLLQRELRDGLEGMDGC